MKRQLFFHLFLMAVGTLVFGGCSQDDETGNLATGDPVEIRFTVGRVSDYAGDTSAETRSPAEPFTVSVPVDDDYEIEATFVPRKTEQTRASESTLGENTRYRVLAYSGGTAYSGYADYKIEGGKSVLIGGGLRLMGGQYKFIAYSYNSGNTIVGTPDENTDVNELAVSTNDDFLYWQSELINISGNTSLTIGFQHLFSQLQVVFDATKLGSDFVTANAVLTVSDKAPYTGGIWNLIDESVSTDTSSTQEDGSFRFSTVSGQSITSDAKRLFPISNTTSTRLNLSIEAEFASGRSMVASQLLFFTTTNNELRSNTVYTCIVKFKPSEINIEGNEINGYPYGGGNCWVIPQKADNRIYSFTAVEGRSNDKIGTTVSGKGTPDSADIVWQIDGDGNETTNLIKDVTYISSTNKMSFTVGTGQSGNAIIAVKAGSTILWSWHIWVVNDNSFMSNPIKIDGVGEFMDRNLGAFASASNSESRGLYYQWGRKDPIRRNNPEIATGPKDISTVTQNPSKFYKNAGNWSTDSSGLWSDTSTDAMLKYNPCPKGWTIPSSGICKLLINEAWLFYSSDINIYYTGNLYIAPERYIVGGTGSEIGSGISRSYYYYWTSTISNTTKSYEMNFSNSLNKVTGYVDTTTRSTGMPIRCIRE